MWRTANCASEYRGSEQHLRHRTFGFAARLHYAVYAQPIATLKSLDGVEKVSIGIGRNPVARFEIVSVLVQRTLQHQHVIEIDRMVRPNRTL